MRHDSVIDAIGHTPLVRLQVAAPDGVEVFAKLEMQNLFAMKDRVAKQVLLQAKQTGQLADGAPIIESSSGTMALGLALVGTYLGHDVHIVTDPRIDPITLAKLDALGCTVHIVRAMTSQGWQSARLERLAELQQDLASAFWPRQYTNPANPMAYAALAAELCADLGRFDVLVSSVGSGGSLCGTARALLPDLPGLRVVAVDCVGSVLFAQPDQPTRRQSGVGNSLHPDNLDHRLIDEVHWLNDDEAFAATRDLAREQMIFGGNTSGSVYRVLAHLAADAAPGTRLVGIFPDRGDRYIEQVYRGALRPAGLVPTPVQYGTPVTTWSSSVLGRAGRPVLLFVESNTTGTGMIALRMATRLGVVPVLLTGRPERYQGLAQTGAQVVRCDTNNADALAAAVTAVADRALLAGVTTTSEFYLEPVAALALRLGLPGNPLAAVRACRDKSLTRAALDRAGVPQPLWATVRDAAQVPAAVARVGLPCVVKPVDDSGSNAVRLCSTVDEAVRHSTDILALISNVRGQPTAGTVLVESYLDGTEVSVEMFADADRHTCVAISRKVLTGRPYFVECQHIFPADLPGPMEAELADTVTAALGATGLTMGAAHVEVRLTAAGPAVVEINARLAGGMIPELVRIATGVDLLEQQLRAALRLPVLLPERAARYAGVRFLTSPEAGVLEQVAGLPQARAVPGVERVTVTAPPGTRVAPPTSAYDRLAQVIAAGTSYMAVQTALHAATTELRLVLREEDREGARCA
jgi:cysteine synthase A